MSDLKHLHPGPALGGVFALRLLPRCSELQTPSIHRDSLESQTALTSPTRKRAAGSGCPPMAGSGSSRLSSPKAHSLLFLFAFYTLWQSIIFNSSIPLGDLQLPVTSSERHPPGKQRPPSRDHMHSALGFYLTYYFSRYEIVFI